MQLALGRKEFVIKITLNLTFAQFICCCVSITCKHCPATPKRVIFILQDKSFQFNKLCPCFQALFSPSHNYFYFSYSPLYLCSLSVYCGTSFQCRTLFPCLPLSYGYLKAKQHFRFNYQSRLFVKHK